MHHPRSLVWLVLVGAFGLHGALGEPPKSPEDKPGGPIPPASEEKLPSLPLPPSQAPLLPLPLKPMHAPTGPRFLPGEQLPSLSGAAAAQPETPPLSVGPRVRIASADVSLRPPLPLLAQPVPEPAVLIDPTSEASSAAALAAPAPIRANPAPFLRLSVPDPFANRRPLPPLPEENLPEPIHPRQPKEKR
jgi:hypothetical protein